LKKIIISGFDPFDKLKINPSMEVVRSLKPEEFKDCKIYPLVLPTVYGESAELLVSKIIEVEPDLVLSLGVAMKGKKISLERFAINIDDCRTKDNRGEKRRGVTIVPQGREAYMSLLPLEDILKELHRYKIKAYISNFCGTFVCNHLMYTLLHYTITHELPFKYGFVHLPGLDTMRKGKKTGMSLEKMVKTVKIIVDTSLE